MAAANTTFDPAALLKQWGAAMQLAPSTLVQPILPGWTFVNNFNSSAPQTEAQVVQRHSYGRQLGRLGEALAILIVERDPGAKDKRFEPFRKMQEEIEDIKAGDAVARVERLLADLDLLKVLRPEEHERLKVELKKRLPAR